MLFYIVIVSKRKFSSCNVLVKWLFNFPRKENKMWFSKEENPKESTTFSTLSIREANIIQNRSKLGNHPIGGGVSDFTWFFPT